MTIDSLETLLSEQLRDIYDAEKQITKALPKMAKAAESEELKAAFTEHLEVTKRQIGRLEEVFQMMGGKAKSKPCAGMKGLIEEGEEIINEDSEEPFGDEAIIAAAQKVEHYEIAAYGTVRTFAKAMGNDRVAELLEQTLDEEKEMDKKCTMIAESILAEIEEEEEDISGEEEIAQAAPSTKPRRTGKK